MSSRISWLLSSKLGLRFQLHFRIVRADAPKHFKVTEGSAGTLCRLQARKYEIWKLSNSLRSPKRHLNRSELRSGCHSRSIQPDRIRCRLRTGLALQINQMQCSPTRPTVHRHVYRQPSNLWTSLRRKLEGYSRWRWRGSQCRPRASESVWQEKRLQSIQRWLIAIVGNW